MFSQSFQVRILDLSLTDKTHKNLSIKVESSMKILRVHSSLTVFFRVGATITNINIGPLLINRKSYHKNWTCFGNHFEFQYKFLFKLFWLHPYKKKFHTPIFQLARSSVTLFSIVIYEKSQTCHLSTNHDY